MIDLLVFSQKQKSLYFLIRLIHDVETSDVNNNSIKTHLEVAKKIIFNKLSGR